MRRERRQHYLGSNSDLIRARSSQERLGGKDGALRGRSAVLPNWFGSRPIDQHGGIGFKEEQRAVLCQSKVYSRIIKPQYGGDLREPRHSPLSQRGRHIFEEPLFLGPMCVAGQHVSGEIVDLPVGGNRQMQRIESTADAHHTVFARQAVLAARVQILDGKKFVPRQCCDRFRHVTKVIDPQEMLPGMEAGNPEQ